MDDLHKQTKIAREEIEADFKKLRINVAKSMAKRISKELKTEARNAIAHFYSEYHPTSYERHYNFWYTYKAYNKKIKEGVYSAGVVLCVDQLPDEYDTTSGINSRDKKSGYGFNTPENVFYRVYYLGWHGENFYGPSLTPIQRIKTKQEEILNNIGVYQNDAMNEAMNNKSEYKHLFQ